MVPCMYLIAERLRRPMSSFYGTRYIALMAFTGPFFFLLVAILYAVQKARGKKVWMGQLR